MCLILLAVASVPGVPLVVAANRDEFHSRPSAGVHRWPGGTVAGRDLEAGGTWLGVDSHGRFAAVTNFSEPEPPADPAAGWLSRGGLVTGFLEGTCSAERYADSLDGQAYRGFNLLLWDRQALWHSSNRGVSRRLPAGVHAIANGGLDEDRFKVQRGKARLGELLAAAGDDREAVSAELLALLGDRERPASAERRVVPGLSGEEAAALASCFIVGDRYGTRASSALLVGNREVLFAERSFGPRGRPLGDSLHRFRRS
jgi:uncharacterized protein with NRDE domain